MITCILNGGKSSRMGFDKATATLNNTSLFDIALQNAAELQMPIIVSANASNTIQTKTGISFSIVNDLENVNIKGPLLGLYSVHKQFPTEDIFLMAVDMPYINNPTIKDLFNTAIQLQNNNHHQAIAFSVNDFIEPICAIYTATGLQNLQLPLLKSFSLLNVLKTLEVFTINLPKEQATFLHNINAPTDL
jgi:molybdenum cofactor guanylyltransferase